jgi:hypothetical protein
VSSKVKGRDSKKVVDLVVVLFFGGLLIAGIALWALALRGPAKTVAIETTPLAQSASIKLSWDKSPSAAVTGYRILYGPQSKVYIDSMTVGNESTALLVNLKKKTKYYIVAVAIDANGNQSPPSNEIEVITSE